ncbi:transmembrane and TPR repeat-containing 2-like protein [Labeo rohita]|uniref:Transmembrane and TPR repeat-containing 2-like protein n=1 Tax=Labeo rohita TaxID=84645 RepID=A0A498MBY2_LABRO|nr:transmembrane and TPR repeat-containing 2-like protein [Labeo rohita]RXN24718.1 transmembrane and TPR repeat-containing 2-like protein [Labeo rohita]
MIAELVCSAVALLLYVNTLDADFCYDDRRCWSVHPVDPTAHFGSVVMSRTKGGNPDSEHLSSQSVHPNGTL